MNCYKCSFIKKYLLKSEKENCLKRGPENLRMLCFNLITLNSIVSRMFSSNSPNIFPFPFVNNYIDIICYWQYDYYERYVFIGANFIWMSLVSYWVNNIQLLKSEHSIWFSLSFLYTVPNILDWCTWCIVIV